MDQQKLIGFQLKELSQMIKRNIDERIDMNVKDVTSVQGHIMIYIYHHMFEGDVFQKDLEKEFYIRRSTVAGTLQLLEKKGLVIRESVPYDARLKKLKLTPKAIAMQEQIKKEVYAMEKQLLNGFSEGEEIIFRELLNKMVSNLEK